MIEVKHGEDFFQNNLKLWTKRHGEPPLADQMLEFCQTGKKGELNVKWHAGYLHSSQNISVEVREALSLFDPLRDEWLLIYGVGLGYHYLGLKEWLHNDPARRIVYVEDDPNVLKAFLETDGAGELLQDPQADVVFCSVDNQLHANLQDLIQSFLFRLKHLGALSSYFLWKRTIFDRFAFLFRFFLDIQEGTTAEYLNRGAAFFQNFYKNLLHLDNTKNGAVLVDQFKGIPAIICGAGPSLRKNIEILKTLKNKALIFAGGTAMNALNAYGVCPHFGCGVDPFSFHLSRILSNIGFETPFFFRSRMTSQAVDLVHGPHIYLPGSIGYPIGEWLDRQLKYPEFVLDDGANVINLTLSLAKKLGCNPILTVGLDLAYSDGLSYPPGLKSHGIDDPRKQFVTKGEMEELHLARDINGDPIYTLMKWMIEASWYSAFSSHNPEITFINCTEGGIGFQGVQNMSLRTCADQHLNQSYDLEGMVANALSSKSAMQAPDFEQIKEALALVEDSLKECLQILCSGDSEEAIEEKLKEQVAYQTILAPFDKVYRLYMESQEPHLFSTIQKSLPTRIPYLKELAKDNLQAIQEALELKKKEEAALHQSASAPKFPSIQRPKCYVEGDHFFIGEASYPLEQNGVLSGPSDYYDPSGALLSRVWYVDGKKEGVALTFAKNGQLLSEKEFKDDLEEGTHLYFYPDGKLKSLITYSRGLLDGPVFLYFRNGALMRSCYFKGGKRVGIDTIYTLNGNPLFQSHYQDDLPVGLAKVWDADGLLRKEVTYSFPGKLSEIKEWNDEGKLISDETRGGDYFDTVTRESLQLQTAFSKMNKSLQGIVSTLKRDLSSDVQEELEIGIKDLDQKVTELKEMGEKLLQVSGIEDQKKEFIWKTQMNERRIHEILQGFTSPMQEALLKLQWKLREMMRPSDDEHKKDSK